MESYRLTSFAANKENDESVQTIIWNIEYENIFKIKMDFFLQLSPKNDIKTYYLTVSYNFEVFCKIRVRPLLHCKIPYQSLWLL